MRTTNDSARPVGAGRAPGKSCMSQPRCCKLPVVPNPSQLLTRNSNAEKRHQLKEAPSTHTDGPIGKRTMPRKADLAKSKPVYNFHRVGFVLRFIAALFFFFLPN